MGPHPGGGLAWSGTARLSEGSSTPEYSFYVCYSIGNDKLLHLGFWAFTE